MIARKPPRDPDGDGTFLHQLLVEAKCVVKRRLASAGTPVDVPASPYLVVPVLGQSNAQGMGFPLDPDGLDRPHPLVHQWAMCGPSKGKAIAGVDPLIHEVPSKGVGFGMTFAKHLADETGRTVLLIPGARGDTSFTPKNGYSWDPHLSRVRVNLYDKATRAIDDALASVPGSQVAAFLWHQGETDVPLTRGPVYQAKLDLLIDSLRARYGREVPFLLGGMVPEVMEHGHRDYPVIDAVHADTPNRHARTRFVPGPRGCSNSPDDPHFNAAGQRELGHLMFASYREICDDELANDEVDLKRAALILCSAVVIVLVLVGVSGYLFFTRAPMDPLRRADAIIVLGGEHDGREDYGLSLARDGWAPTVVISNPYPSDDPVMRRVCNESGDDVVVICQRPNPVTTRGEAEMTRRLARERSWKTIIVLSWQYHLPRARFIFNECLGGHDGVIVMRAVPRGYHKSFLYWEFTYLYQYGGLMKAVVQGDCS